ncbi:MAG: addiction module protein [Fibrobacterales bacterium]
MSEQLAIFNERALSGFDMDFQKHIKNMSTSERLNAMELLWNSLHSESEEIASPDWHQEILEARSQNPQKMYTLDQVKDQLK